MIAYQRCPECTRVWYFPRGFCPGCGHEAPQALESAGGGVVHAVTIVHRPPAAELRPEVPYAIVLVDADEVFRLMAHGSLDLGIGERVAARSREFWGRTIPFFVREAG